MKFYVYEHWRPDLDVPFYVGKGHGRRAYIFKRNRFYNFIASRLSKAGMCVEVRMVACGIGEEAAFLLEIERIGFWRGRGVQLVNMTDGGEGLSNPSAAVRLLIGAAHRGKTASLESRQKMSASQKKRMLDPAERAKCVNPPHIIKNNPLLQKGRIVTDKQRLAQSIAHTGRKDTTETKKIKSEAGKARHVAHPLSDDARAKIGIKHLGNKHALGCERNEETRAKMSRSQKMRFSELRDQGIVPKPALGHTVSEETRMGIAAKLKGRPRAPEAIAKHRATLAARRAAKEAVETDS